MPVKLDSKNKETTMDCDDKSKKNRYSLKRFLDRSRFSPRLLRLSKPNSKSGVISREIEQSNVGDDNLSNLISDLKLVGPGYLSPHSPSSQRHLTSSVPLNEECHTVYSFRSDFKNPTCDSDGTATPSSDHVEEEYEESLSHFTTDLLLLDDYKLKKSHFQTNKSPDDNISNWSHEMINLATYSSEDVTTNNHPLQQPNPDYLVPPSRSDSIDGASAQDHNLPSLEVVGNLDPSSIYNEPCDAKPGLNSEDPVTIYTLSNTTSTIMVKDNCIMHHKHLNSSSTNSSSGLKTGENKSLFDETKTNQITQNNIAANQSLSNTIDSPDITPNQRLNNSQLTSSSSPSSISSSSSSSAQQQLVVYPNSPRGNTVIMHHPASPFARVPRLPLVKNDTSNNLGFISQLHPISVCNNINNNEPIQLKLKPIQTTNETIPVDTTSLSPPLSSPLPLQRMVGPSTSNPLRNNFSPDRNLQNDLKTIPVSNSHKISPSTVNATMVVNPTAVVNTGQSPRQPLSTRSRPGAQESHPTYEEAWDVKMARQLGIGIKRLGPMDSHLTPITSQQNAKSSEPIESGDKKFIIIRASNTSPNPTHSQSQLEQINENCEQNKEPQHKENNEYDYAYNGSWSMGVQLNLSLAINNNKVMEPTTVISPHMSTATTVLNSVTPIAVNNIKASDYPICTPFVRCDFMRKSAGAISCSKYSPKSQPLNLSHINPELKLITSKINLPKDGEVGVSTHAKSIPRPQMPQVISNDFDNISTDSYDESWDTRHGRVISELTRSRFIDPSSVLSNTDTDQVITTAVSRLSGNPNLASPLLLSSSPTQHVGVVPETTFHLTNNTNRKHCRSPLTTLLPTQPHRTQANNLELLPLNEQPWYHSGLTRFEAEELLLNEPEGSFLVRPSETCPNDFSLTIKHKTFLHMKITRNNVGQFILGEYSQPYATVPQMIYHYANKLIPVRGADSVTLTHPVTRRTP